MCANFNVDSTKLTDQQAQAAWNQLISRGVDPETIKRLAQGNLSGKRLKKLLDALHPCPGFGM